MFKILKWNNTTIKVNGAVWSNLLLFLTHQLFGRSHLESIIHLLRNQVVDLSKQKLKTVPYCNFKVAGSFLKISFFFSCFSHIFVIANLPGFSISKLANVEEFLVHINIFSKCNYICEYKRLFVEIYLCSMLLQTLFSLPHLFCNVEFELIQLISQHQTLILIPKISERDFNQISVRDFNS